MDGGIIQFSRRRNGFVLFLVRTGLWERGELWRYMWEYSIEIKWKPT